MIEDKAWRLRWIAIVNKIKRIETPVEKVQMLDKLCEPTQPTVLAFANAHALNSVIHSKIFFEALKSADWLVRDGTGMAALFWLLKMRPGLNLNGTDFIPSLIERFNGRTLAVFGTQAPHLHNGVQVIKTKLAPLSSCTSADGFQEVSIYLKLVEISRPQLIILGMGMPKQESVAAALRADIKHPCLIVCGGAIIDFLGGKIPRAPQWMQNTGLEWVFRLAMEPKRLFYRYVIGNPSFIARAVLLAAIRSD